MTSEQAWRWVEAHPCTLIVVSTRVTLMAGGYGYSSWHTDPHIRVIEVVTRAIERDMK